MIIDSVVPGFCSRGKMKYCVGKIEIVALGSKALPYDSMQEATNRQEGHDRLLKMNSTVPSSITPRTCSPSGACSSQQLCKAASKPIVLHTVHSLLWVELSLETSLIGAISFFNAVKSSMVYLD